MEQDGIIFTVFLVFSGAALLAALALFARQSLLVAYIVLGLLLGPQVFGLVDSPEVVEQSGHIGIIFLLFLLGLNLHPQKLVALLGQATRITLASGAVFALTGFSIAYGFGFAATEALLVGAAMVFSSTIIGLKLMPATALHHRHMGEVVISVLLLQDIIAIVLLVVVQSMAGDAGFWREFSRVAVALPALVLLAYLGERFLLTPLMARLDTIQEYLFLAAIGWCLGLAQLAHAAGLSYEIGAFAAGVALARQPISRFIAESLRPLRDFFLILFFFSLGADFDLRGLAQLWLPASVLALAMLALKPWVFAWLMRRGGETPRFALETGTRLGQLSEFSLLLAFLAGQAGVIGGAAQGLVQAATLLTFVISSTLVMWRFPTPIAVSEDLRRD
ncbi:MAG: cation:proton antiporter [Gammaproteobacteria bacterium]|nr:cation:proton antiporter [Gammaproteobacteria bacterium]